MTDDAFHLTPLDVRRFEFPPGWRGYDRDRVDAFRGQVADELERLTRQLQEMDAKAKGFHEQLRAFRERDKALNDALVSAQQLRVDMKEQAEKEAQLILREAKSQAAELIESAKAQAKTIASELVTLERSRRAYLSQLKLMTERQLTEIEAAFDAMFPQKESPDGTPPDEHIVAHRTPAWLKSLVEE